MSCFMLYFEEVNWFILYVLWLYLCMFAPQFVSMVTHLDDRCDRLVAEHLSLIFVSSLNHVSDPFYLHSRELNVPLGPKIKVFK